MSWSLTFPTYVSRLGGKSQDSLVLSSRLHHFRQRQCVPHLHSQTEPSVVRARPLWFPGFSSLIFQYLNHVGRWTIQVTMLNKQYHRLYCRWNFKMLCCLYLRKRITVHKFCDLNSSAIYFLWAIHILNSRYYQWGCFSKSTELVAKWGSRGT